MRLNALREDRNWLYLLMALLVSMILWYTINAREKIERLVQVRLDYKGLPADLTVLRGQLNSVQVRLRGPQELFRNVDSRDLSRVIDLGGVVRGENVIVLDQNAGTTFRMFQVLEVIPSRMILDIDAILVKTLPVAMRAHDADSLGDVQIGWLSVSPASVTLRGPERLLASLDSLLVEAQVQVLDEDRTQIVEAPVLAPPGVEVKPSTVLAEYTASVRRRSANLVRSLQVEDAGGILLERCEAAPPRVRLRVAVPERLVRDGNYLDAVRTAIVLPEAGLPENGELPIQVHMPPGTRLESIAPAMGVVRCRPE